MQRGPAQASLAAREGPTPPQEQGGSRAEGHSAPGKPTVAAGLARLLLSTLGPASRRLPVRCGGKVAIV